MTRQLSSTGGFTTSNFGSLPTSRHASGQELGILSALRSLAPRRALSSVEAEQCAETQADRLLTLAGLTTPPTPSELIAELPRVLVRIDSDLPTSAATQWVNGRWLLLINGSEPIERQRFSLAHEYKHALDHRHHDLLYVDRPGFSANDQAEQAADAFAAAVLMPAAWVERAWADGIRRLSDLSSLFQVSPRAMVRRLERLDLRSAVNDFNRHLEAV
jgi:hypothetical protein